ncbi:MAG: hypothetical protein HY080_07705 [Gammaproteobacteria bacterium]|nr:hypothetical protein [Gammaproteobacteria bacterium]
MLRLSIAIALVALSCTSYAAEELPLGILAVKVPEAAVAAVKFRDAGKPKEFLTNALPPKGSPMSRMGREMHQIADDIYEFTKVKGLTYFAYTHNRFIQELKGKPAPSRFNQVASEVLACQDKFPETDQQKLIQCVTTAVENYVPKTD